MVQAGKTEREFCAACGWPRRGMRCEACGVERLDLDLVDAGPAEIARAFEPNDVVGDKIAEAFRGKEWTRLVGLVVGLEGGATARAAATDEGPGWIAVVRGAAVLVTVRQVEQQVSMEAPIVRLPREQRVAVLRAALELSAHDGLSPVACLRDDLLILRSRLRLAALTPALLRRVLGDLGQRARRSTEMFAAAFLARPAAPLAEIASIGFDSLGTPRRLAKAIADVAPLALDSPRAAPPPQAPAVPSLTPMALVEPAPDSVDRDSIPPILAPLFAGSKRSPSAPPAAPTPAVSRPQPGPGQGQPARPAARAPDANAPRAAADSLSLPEPSRPQPPPAAPRRPQTGDLFLEDRKRTIKDGQPARPNGDRGRLATLELEAVGPDLEPSGRRAPSGEVAVLPADRFCALLRRAELLAAPAAAASSPALGWIVRAAVFRAVYDFRETLPDAVANIYRMSGVAKRDAPSEPDAALAAFDAVVSANAAVAKEKPLLLDPMTSAQQAKEQVAHYIAEIEQATAELGLKHYLAVGGLCELLVRAKLPAQTTQRLRDIISHAQREGAKPAVIDLLMTALKRISA